ncbi:MAG: M23 family metallopeptidase [Bacteroidetes bacterium]|nr:M23 family metallopeptidase [Bacteroidota bacterium]
MFRNMRFFVFSSKSLDLSEGRFFKVKVLGSGLLLGIVLLTVIFFVNVLAGDVLGIGYGHLSMLTTENRMLKEHIRDLGKKLQLVQQTLESLSERGNELRLMADLRRIDDDTRAAAVGGAAQSAATPFLTGEANTILAESRTLIDQLSREVKLQQQSYEEIHTRLQQNKGFFAHLPAIKPMAGPYTVGGFGMRMHPVLHVYRMHYGLDIINDVGTPVYAAGDGTVRVAGRTQGGLGILVEITHGYGYASLYAHLSQVHVTPGQNVKRGELIGKCGRTGLVSGPHLHYEVRRNGVSQNPVDFFFDDIDAARYRAMLAQAGANL